MSASWKTGAGPSLILLVALIVCGGSCIYSARQFARAEPNEKTAAAHVVSVEHHIFRYFRSNFYSCSYNFSVDGSFYVENEDCPQGISDDAANGKYSDSAGALMEANATVYYDPADPSVNSLLEFNAASESYYRQATSLICVGALIIFFFVFGAAIEATKNRGNGPVFVDARGTVIYPDEINFGSEIGGMPSGSRKAEESYATANGEASSAADVTHSSELRELYLEVVKQIHPDLASSEADRTLRERLTKDANIAFEQGDDATLRRVLEEYASLAPQR
ncbi:MAG: DUF3592 domain-containing protein [Terracidiphilus sp.]|jgi:hypothetical protein